MNNDTDWLQQSVAAPNDGILRAAETRQAHLTKPPGALGRLESTATRLAALQGAECPCVDRVHISIFAADHGVAAEGVSAFPQAVTVEMIKNFARGGAAINVLAGELGAQLEVINLGTVSDPGPLEGVLSLRLGPGTTNFCEAPAMHEDQLVQALDAGRQAAERASLSGAQLYIGGEMGIGNTTTAAALACALLDATPEALAGPGTGLDQQGVARKVEVIRRALHRHRQHHTVPQQALRCLGGFEIAALAGSYIRCAHRGLPVLVDGFISSVAALAAMRLCPGAENWFLFSHTSAEPGHRIVLEALAARPLLELGMRLGEGSGAATAVPLLRMACALHNGMATFAEAEVSGQE
ncbi:nicotinate-nucleotide--dimethylbenzimidazole phosphoribosyltransferase [Sulfuriflexus mobilis]|uniref:nicotinate-nucleotide--dimethylbenzimidazole phosphoribosyltransferase n=1 Tax=Sulfuriflexus mobilis TaxID=1811807 RepID=UPI000F8234CF|nr:nicotinate-nucleotide--dimethylbenzimidazole phosphoribosyltransferase [Sulfuriflexus mobilis]